MATWLNLTLQDRASPIIEQLIFFHDHALIIILIIITTVFYTIIRIIQNKQTRRFILEGQIIETVWTIAPAIILVFIAIPSLRLLYLIDEIHNPVITLKNGWTPMILKLRILRFHKTRIWLIYSKTRRFTNQYIPTTRYRQPNCTTDKFTNPNNCNCSRCIAFMNST